MMVLLHGKSMKHHLLDCVHEGWPEVPWVEQDLVLKA